MEMFDGQTFLLFYKTYWNKFHQCSKGCHILYVIFNREQKN